MKSAIRKSASLILSLLLIMTVIMPGMTAFAASASVVITDSSGNDITDTVEVQEYRSVQLSYRLAGDVPEGAYVEWTSNLPLLANVDDSGKVTGYDYSKAAIIQLWLDENVRSIPLIGESMASSIENAIFNSGYDLETVNTDILVALVRGIAGDTIADSLSNYLDNMNVVITATLYSSTGSVLARDTVDVLVTQSMLGSVAPTGVHITNKKTVPKTVAVGTTVQLYGAVTPVRLKQGIKWAVGSGTFDFESSRHATVDSNGLVTFTSAGTVTVRVNPESTIYGLFSDTVTFTVLNPADYPVTDFSITGDTSVAEGETTQLALDNVVPAGAYTGSVVWSSSDESIAVVDNNGMVTGLDGGNGLVFSKSVTISATIDGVTKSVNVSVTRSLINSNLSAIEIDGESVVPNDSSSQYSSTVYPARLNTNSSVIREWGLEDNGSVIWATSSADADTSLATISSNGLLTPKASGVIVIHAKATYNNASVETSLQVLAGKAITDFTISGSSSVTENKTTQLSITNIAPSDYDQALLSTVRWYSANPEIASVDANGLVSGLDAGGYGPLNSQTTTIYASINGVTKSFSIKVNGALINYVTSAEIIGFDNVIRDFPVQYQSVFSPERMSISSTLWGLPTDNGEAPWTASNYVTSSSNMSNSIASVSSNGLVTGLSAGSTTLYLYGRHNFTSHNQALKPINVVEVEPLTITITPPSRTTYVEGETNLDLSGLKVELTYDRDDIEEYYGDTSSMLSDDQLKVSVSDYTVSEINQSLLDTEQYIVVSVVRAGRTYRGIFSITLESKALTDIEITSPQTRYVEGVTELDLTGLTVKANYSNAASEYVDDYTVETGNFDPTLFNVEQPIRVSYSHAGRVAEAYFNVIVYGIPVVSVDTNGYSGAWTSDEVTFSLDSTNKLDGITYYYRTESLSWQAIAGDSFTAFENSDETYYFKAVNSEGIESAETQGYNVRHDNVTPSFSLSKAISTITNQSYDISIDNLVCGISGVREISVNGTDIGADARSFTADENGEYTFTVTANNGLSHSESITVDNIDKIAPVVNSITLSHKNDGSIARLINSITFGHFFNRKIEISIDASDEGVAGIDTVEYRFLDENGIPLSAEWTVYDGQNKPEQDPSFRGFVQARATDNAGNVSDYLRSDGYVIDEDAPTDITVTAVSNGESYTDDTWAANDVTISLESYAFSGIYQYLYRIDGGEWTALESDSLTISNPGVYFIEFMAISNAALDSNISSITVKIDKQIPVIRVSFVGSSGRWTGEDIEFTFSTMEASLSGITYYYKDDTDIWKKVTTGNEFVISESTNARYQFKAVNGAGTESNPSDEYLVMIDSKLPEIHVEQEVTDATCVPYKLYISTVSGASGIKSVVLNDVDITGQDEVTVTENGNYLFTVTSNTQKTSTYLLVIDNFYTPVFEIESVSAQRLASGGFSKKSADGLTTYYDEAAEITISAVNTGVSGIQGIHYILLDEDMNQIGGYTDYDESDKPVISSDFKGYIKARAVDNQGAFTDEYVSGLIVVEVSGIQAPAVSAVSGGNAYLSGQRTNKEITMTLDAAACSGTEVYRYRVDGGAWATLDSGSLTALSGLHRYEFMIISAAGNESAVTEFTTNYDPSLADPSVRVYSGMNAYTGQSISVPVSIEDNPGISSYAFELGFDSSAIRVDDIVPSAGFDTGFTKEIDNANGSAVVSWISASDVSASSDIFTLEITVLTDASADTQISVSAVNAAMTDADGHIWIPDCEGGSVTLNPPSTISNITVYNLSGRAIKTVNYETGPDATFGNIRRLVDSYSGPKENKEFIGWKDADGNFISDDTVMFGNYSIYPVYEDTILLEGAFVIDRPASSVYLKGLVSDGTSAGEIRTYLDNDSDQIQVYRDGVLLADDELVGTGCIVKCVSLLSADRVYDEAVVLLRGDLDGDGLPTDTDHQMLMDAVLDKGSLNEIQFMVADIDEDGILDGFDAAAMDRMLDDPNALVGDVNGDGLINSTDYAMARAYTLAENSNGPQSSDLLDSERLGRRYTDLLSEYPGRVFITQEYYSADVNRDKSVDGLDVIYLQLYLNGMVSL